MAGFLVDAAEAERLAAEIGKARTILVPAIRNATKVAGKAMQDTARQLAKSESMPGLSRSIYTKTTHNATGTEVVVEAKSPFGYIREFGAGRSGPHPFMLPALEAHTAAWETACGDALESSGL